MSELSDQQIGEIWHQVPKAACCVSENVNADHVRQLVEGLSLKDLLQRETTNVLGLKIPHRTWPLTRRTKQTARVHVVESTEDRTILQVGNPREGVVVRLGTTPYVGVALSDPRAGLAVSFQEVAAIDRLQDALTSPMRPPVRKVLGYLGLKPHHWLHSMSRGRGLVPPDVLVHV